MGKTARIKSIAVANKVCGGIEIDKEVVTVYLSHLDGYDDGQILGALNRCMRECRGQLALRDIIDRIVDGWPDPQEAWALCPAGEADTAVWTDEIAEAFECVRGMDDRVGARVAFLEIYKKKVSTARAEHRRPKWTVSLGHDQGRRPAVLRRAEELGRLRPGTAARICPELAGGDDEQAGELADPQEVKRLVASVTESRGPWRALTSGDDPPDLVLDPEEEEQLRALDERAKARKKKEG